MLTEPLRVAVVGGAGHVGLPLSLLLAKHGLFVTVIDQDRERIERLMRGEFPFAEAGGQELLHALRRADEPRRLVFCSDPLRVAVAEVILLTVGTPVDEQGCPDEGPLRAALDDILPALHDGQVLILRSTVFPGTSQAIQERLHVAGLRVSVGFCPERIAQGRALEELQRIPQLIAGSDARALAAARALFGPIAPELIELSMIEAEVAKLFTNAWRYMTFALVNHFYAVATAHELDFYRIREAMTRHYPRMDRFPIAGFAAGPCLRKDAMQLASYSGHLNAPERLALQINDGLPHVLIQQAKRQRDLTGVPTGILGMAFKADCDDFRDSLAYRLRALLRQEGAMVMCTDPYIRDPEFVPLEQVLRSCQLFFIGCPHAVYRQIAWAGRAVIDCWGLTGPADTTGRCQPHDTPRAGTVAVSV